MKLVLVESPTKARVLDKYLGPGYTILATKGHVRDLPKKELGVDVKHDFAPDYEVVRGKGKVIKEIKTNGKKADLILVAVDPDREGEAIGWHTLYSAGLINEKGQDKKAKPDVRRVVFHEITKGAVLAALEHPRSIDMNLVDAQQGRRVLDRLVGYKLSPLLWKKIRFGLSAGRVQSVAVRLIVEREREREDFKPEEYWDILAFLKAEGKGSFDAKLVSVEGKKSEVKTEKVAKEVTKDLEKADWQVAEIAEKEVKKNPYPPYKTSTLQQDANNRLGFNGKKTMQVAQQLYQGVNLGDKGHAGLITYMRTDSFNLSPEAVSSARDFVKEKYGERYVPEKPRFFKTRSKLAQEAHEAIRPTDLRFDPESIKQFLDKDQYRLYKLIWDRFLACQMSSARFGAISVKVEAESEKSYLFSTSVEKQLFDGYRRVYVEESGKQLEERKAKEKKGEVLKKLEKGEKLTLEKLTKEQHFTKPPARYTDASLVKALEAYGIGRPSTYAPIISTIIRRGYVDRDGRYLFPTDSGCVVNDFLVKHFSDIVDYDFTSGMESDLDAIAQGKKKWVKVVSDFYFPFEKLLLEKQENVKREDVTVIRESDEKCPECGGPMVVKLGKYGKFLSCKKFPKCKGMKSLEEEDKNEAEFKKNYLAPGKCEKCGGDMELKRGKFGRFWACSNYPKCKSTAPLLLKEKCPQCGKNLVEKKGKWGKSFTGCSGYPECRYIKRKAKKEEGK